MRILTDTREQTPFPFAGERTDSPHQWEGASQSFPRKPDAPAGARTKRKEPEHDQR